MTEAKWNVRIEVPLEPGEAESLKRAGIPLEAANRYLDLDGKQDTPEEVLADLRKAFPDMIGVEWIERKGARDDDDDWGDDDVEF